MFQVVVQTVIRHLRSQKKPPAPSVQRDTERKPADKQEDRTGLILALAFGGGILAFAMFSNLPSN